ncbi:ATP-dependent helicase, partial [Dissulfurirhabdus thermomarina]
MPPSPRPPAHLAGLNPEQLAAVRHRGGPLLVEAGPGTGKTRVLAARAADLLSDGTARAGGMLAVTFTNQAAAEIRGRIAAWTGGTEVRVATFHGWALAFLNEALGAAAPAPVDEADARELCAEAAAEIGLSPAEGRRRWPEVSTGRQHHPPRLPDETLARLAAAYEARLGRDGLTDFDGLILHALRLLGDPGRRAALRRALPILLVDEFQDVSPAQYELVRAMAAPGGEVTVIGDPDQAIYGFRGASPAFMARFRRDFPGTTVVRLRQAYRCPQTFLDAAGAVLGAEAGRLRADRPERPRLEVRAFADPGAEARWIARAVEGAVG